MPSQRVPRVLAVCFVLIIVLLSGTDVSAQAPPTATTGAATGITGSGATINGVVNANGSSTTVTFEYGTTAAYGTTVTADQSPVTGSTDTAVSRAISGLASNTTFHFRVVGTNVNGTTNGADMTFTTNPQAPTITTQAVSSITTTTAVGNANITNLGNPNPTAHGVVWNTGGTPTTADSHTDEGAAASIGPFPSNITGLSPNTTYYVRAYATNTAGTVYGNEVSFTTVPSAPTATTSAATAVGLTGATLNGTVNANGASTTVTFEYGTTTAYGTTVTADQSPVTGSTDTAVSRAISGLTSNTTYHFRVVATNSGGTTNGADMTFTTNPQAPTVTTQAVSGITTTTAVGNANITNLGNPNPTAHGVVWNTGGTPTTADSHTDEGPAASIGAFSSNITGLSPNTTYYVRAYATNTAGTVYGHEVSFTTDPPGPTATTSAATAVGPTGATLNGTVNANNDSMTVTFEYGTTVAYGTTVTADQSPVTGSTDTPVSAVLTGLTPNTVYHYRVVGQNSSGTTLGTDVTFATLLLGEIPVLSREGAAVLISLLALVGALAIRRS